jgi:hypothetical protein
LARRFWWTYITGGRIFIGRFYDFEPNDPITNFAWMSFWGKVAKGGDIGKAGSLIALTLKKDTRNCILCLNELPLKHNTQPLPYEVVLGKK